MISLFEILIALAIALVLIAAVGLPSKRELRTLFRAFPQAFVFVVAVIIVVSLSACSALSGLTGSTSSTPSNPTGAPLSSDTLSVAVPAHATVAANCAKGDANSCGQMATVAQFCKANSGVQEALKPCTDNGWMQ